MNHGAALITRPDGTKSSIDLRSGSLEPYVLTCEHASRRLPWLGRPDREEGRILASHWGFDIGAWDLTRELSRLLGSCAIGGRWSRLLIDLNRRVDDPTLIREQAGAIVLTWNAGIGVAERERRILTYHSAYHERVDRLIVRRLVRDIRPLLFAVHSFTPRLEGANRGFDAGVLYEHHGGLARRLAVSLRGAGLRVRYNEPYSGMAGMMYSVDRHGKHHDLPCLELEVNQALFSKERAPARLARVVARGLRDLSGLL